MKRVLPLLLCLLLSGCARKPLPEPPPESTVPPAVMEASAGQGLYDPGSALEQATAGAVRVYPLRFSTVTAMGAWKDGLLIFSVGNGATVITKLSGETLQVTASAVLGCQLDMADPSVQIWGDSLACFDESRGQTVLLDRDLKEIAHYPAPPGLQGKPLLREDRSALYYCTSDALRSWDLETGLHRCVKEMSLPGQAVTGLHVSDTILQCAVREAGREKTLLLSAQDGRLLYEAPGSLSLATDADRYFAAIPAGAMETLVFGRGDWEQRVLSPLGPTEKTFYLPEKRGALAIRAAPDGSVLLDYYDLTLGQRTSCLSLSGAAVPLGAAVSGGAVWFLRWDEGLGCPVLCRWDTTAPGLSPADSALYVGPCYTAREPDLAGLAECQALAGELGAKYGLDIRLGADALAVQPQDYAFQMEYLVPVLRQELERLDGLLAQYPAAVLEQTRSHFPSVRLCLVREILPVSEDGSQAPGLQFWEGTDAYAALPVGPPLEWALHYGLCQVMETHILSKSAVLYRWEDCNPPGFSYSGESGDTAEERSWLSGGDPFFLDEASMVSPKEDRSRIFAAAMLPGNRELFQSPALQRKLSLLCQAIRQACGLRKNPESLPWEQYLAEPLAGVS